MSHSPPLLITRKRNKTIRKMTPMTMMMKKKKRKTNTNDPIYTMLVSLRLSSHTRDKAAKAITAKRPLTVVDLLYDVLLGEAVQAVSRREP